MRGGTVGTRPWSDAALTTNRVRKDRLTRGLFAHEIVQRRKAPYTALPIQLGGYLRSGSLSIGVFTGSQIGIRIDKAGGIPYKNFSRGRNSAVECQLPKLDVAGSSPVSRSIFQQLSRLLIEIVGARLQSFSKGDPEGCVQENVSESPIFRHLDTLLPVLMRKEPPLAGSSSAPDCRRWPRK